MGFVKEFKDFINNGNVIDLAVAVVMGAAFGKIVTAMVEGVIMPLVGKVLPSGSWQTATLGPIQIGRVLGESINFVVIALVVFIVVKKVMGGIRKKEEAAPAAPPPTPEDIALLREIRDLLKK